MQNKIELNDIELEKVTGGVSDNDISYVKSLITQIITAVSALEDNYCKHACLEYLNEVIEDIDSGMFDSAKADLGYALEEIKILKSLYNAYLNIDLPDTICGITMTMGWTDFGVQ